MIPQDNEAIIRYEFAPFYIGSDLFNPKYQKLAIDILNHLGWEDIHNRFDAEEYENIANQTLGIYRKGDVWIFTPKSGFFVARYTFPLLIKNSIHETISKSLLQRIALHKSISLNGTHESCLEVGKLASELRQRLLKYKHKSLGMKECKRLHEYSFSVYKLPKLFDSTASIYALLHPRDFGCSSSVPEFQIPGLDQVINKIQNWEIQNNKSLDLQTPLSLRNRKLLMYSSWSSVVIQELENCQGSDLVSLCEFRIQSTWFAGLYIQRFANNINPNTLSTAELSVLNTAQQNLDKLINQHKLRIGPNSLSDPSKIMSELSVTSDILKELKDASDTLTYAINQGKYVLDERSSTSRKMLEVFSLVFASSSLAPILFPTPLNTKVIFENMAAFILWATLTVIGIYFVVKQR